MKNTLLHRDALHLKSVCWFGIGSCIENVPFNIKSPFYDVYIYHGVLQHCGLVSHTKLHITAVLTDPETKKTVSQIYTTSSFFGE